MSDLENMDTLRFRERVHQRRRHSQPLTEEEITYITQQSAELADESLTGKAFECLV
jgi:phage-related minor tail protein